MKAIFGKKIGMTSIFETNGRMLPVTVVRCLPNVVLEAKNLNSKDQTIIKVGYGEEKEKNTKAYIGTFKKVNAASREHIATICDFGSQVNVGDMINPNIFESGEYIDVQGVTRGRGYTGAIAR
jgi:large subunit ribosomal protein L3